MNFNIEKEIKAQLYVTLMPLLLNMTLNICFFVLSGWQIGIIKFIFYIDIFACNMAK